MNKKLVAILIAVLMLVGMIPALSMIPPAQAQENDWECDSHPMCVFLHPGILDLYKPGWSHTLDTFWGTQAGDVQRTDLFQHYLDYAILASSSQSIGDLQFDITVTEDIGMIDFYVPPEFVFTAPTIEESIWTDITNDYYFINAVTTSQYDPVAPGWTRILIGLGAYWGNGPDGGDHWGGVIPPKIDPDTGALVPYHIRLMSLAAPTVAGLYHFKFYYWDTNALVRDPNNPLMWNNVHSLGAGNFPIIIVKSELNPAWVEVTVRTELYFATPFVSGKVVAEGTTPEGRAVSAQAYWGPNEFVGNVFSPDLYGNGGAEYRTVLFGLAEGTYDLTPYASGSVAAAVPRITVLAGQSYHQYLHVFDSPDLFVTVYSKHGSGETPWHNVWQLPYGTNNPAADPCDDESYFCPRRDILLELYDSSNKLVAFWSSDDIVLRNSAGPLGSGSWRKWFGWTNRIGWAGAVDPVNGWPLFPINTGLEPTATSFSRHLVDNYDLLLNARGIPGTEWDGHVPWDTADYVNGMVNGAYTLEAFVTGYIMDQPDAYQRSFIVSGIDKSIPFDLRRTNWVEVSMHGPSGVTVAADTTVLLTANDANGNERGSAAFKVTPLMLADTFIDGSDCSSWNSDGSYAGGCIIEGKNGIFPNIGSTVFRGTGSAREATEKDYGLNPTASTHSGGAVALAGNPYTVKLRMADEALPWTGLEGTGWWNIIGGDPQVSVFLCNSPQLLSFTIRPSFVELFIRSVDFEVPAHARPWTFPGSEVWVEFKNEAGETVDVLDPTMYGLIQDAGTTMPGFEIRGVDYAIPEGVQVGYGVSPYDYDSNVHACPASVREDLSQTCAGRHSVLRVKYTGTDWTGFGINGYGLFRTLPAGSALRPTSLPPGQYTIDVHTHGYVLRRAFPVQVPAEGGADIAVDLIQGAEIRVIASFKWEQVKTNFMGFVRVEVLNENDELVGAGIYGRAEVNTFTDNLDGGAYFAAHDPYWYFYDTLYANNMRVPDPAQGAGFGLTDGDLSATPPVIDSVFPSTSHGQRAMWSNLYYTVPECPDELNPACQVWASWDYITPMNANEFVGGDADLGNGWSGGRGTDTVIMDVMGFYWYYGDPARTWAGGWPTTTGQSASNAAWPGSSWDTGLRGSDDLPNWSGSGGGKYHIKIYAFDYRPEKGITRMYAMGWPLSDISLPWGGAEDFYVDMNALATLKGTVSWLDMFGNYRALPWAQITASPGPDDGTPAYTSGLPGAGSPVDTAGEYLMWLPAGTHDVSVSTSEAPGVWGGPAEQNAQYTVVVSDGWVGGGESRLDHTEGVPVPELPAFLVPLGLLAALGASVWLLRKRNLNTPLLMK